MILNRTDLIIESINYPEKFCYLKDFKLERQILLKNKNLKDIEMPFVFAMLNPYLKLVND